MVRDSRSRSTQPPRSLAWAIWSITLYLKRLGRYRIRFITHSCWVELRASIPHMLNRLVSSNSKTEVIPSAGHWMHGEKSAEVTMALSTFLNG